MGGSYDYINYSLRPNKNVERKLILEAVAALGPHFDTEQYRYVGFGSMWFVDFVLAHKILRISDMVSIEADRSREDRAKFNRPFQCVDVRIGRSTHVLAQLGWDKRNLVWLDYDGGLDCEAFTDINFLTQKLASGSLLIVSINADRRQLSGIKNADDSVKSEEEALRHLVANDEIVPRVLPKNFSSKSELPKLVADLLFRQVTRALRVSGRTLQAVPLMNFCYRDGATMVTAGVLLVDDRDFAAYEALHLPSKLSYLTAQQQYIIDVPHLTSKEKAAFDQLLPAKKSPSVKNLGFTLLQSHIEAYYRLYRFYPEFREVNH